MFVKLVLVSGHSLLFPLNPSFLFYVGCIVFDSFFNQRIFSVENTSMACKDCVPVSFALYGGGTCTLLNISQGRLTNYRALVCRSPVSVDVKLRKNEKKKLVLCSLS